MDLGEMFRDYQQTVFGRYVLEDGAGGFMTYSIEDRGIYIADVYVAPGTRKTGVARGMLDTIVAMARGLGKKHIYGTVDCTTKVWRESVAAQEACGFRPAAIRGSSMLLVKDVDEGGAPR